MRRRICVTLAILAVHAFAHAGSRLIVSDVHNGTVYEIRQYQSGGADAFVTWTEAKAEAELLGGHLATISDATEDDFLFNLAAPRADWFNNRMWLGGSDQSSEGWWQWTTGEPWQYQHWATSEPNNANGNEHSLHMCIYSGNCPEPGAWGDHFDIAHFGFFAVEYDDPGPQPVEKIVFQSNRVDGDWNTWIMNPDGSGVELLIDGPGAQQHPAVSPDGKQVVYQNYLDGAFELRLLDLATGSVISLGAIQAWVDWLGDGSGFLGATGGCSGDPIAIDLEGNTSVPFSEGGRQAFGDVDWTTDRMYYTSDPCSSPNTVIRMYDPATGTASNIKDANGRSDGHVSVSRDGSQVVFFEHDSSYQDPAHLYVMNSDGSAVRQITTTTGYRDFHPHFSPDGARVVFTRLTHLSPGTSEIVVVDLASGTETVLLTDGAMHRTMGWASLHLPPACEPGGEMELTIANPLPGSHVDIRYGDQDLIDGATVTVYDGESIQWRLNTSGYSSAWKSFTASCDNRALRVTEDDFCEIAISNPVPGSHVDLRYGPQNLVNGEVIALPKGNTIQWRLNVSGYNSSWKSFTVDEACRLSVSGADYCAFAISNPVPGGHVDLRYGPQDLGDGETVYLPKGSSIQWRLNASGYNSAWSSMIVDDGCGLVVSTEHFCAASINNPVTGGHVDLRYGPQNLLDGATVYLPKGNTIEWRLNASGYSGPWEAHVVDAICTLDVTTEHYCDAQINNPVSGGHVDLRYGPQDLPDGAIVPLPIGETIEWRLNASGYNGLWQPYSVFNRCGLPVSSSDYCSLVIDIPTGAEVDLRYGPQDLVNGDDIEIPTAITVQWRITIDDTTSSWTPLLVGANGCEISY